MQGPGAHGMQQLTDPQRKPTPTSCAPAPHDGAPIWRAMPRTYFYVAPVSIGWALRGGALAGRHPTGVRVQLGVEMWEDIELLGEV